MGLLDQILGGVSGLGSATSRQSSGGGSGVLMALLPVVIGMLTQRGGSAGGMGGLGDLIEQFTHKGYGQHASSWIGTGPNEAFPPQAVSDVFGDDQLAQIARQAGVSTDDARNGMSELLPGLVDHFTPEGKVPGLESMSSSVDDFVRRMNM